LQAVIEEEASELAGKGGTINTRKVAARKQTISADHLHLNVFIL
jgi:hypothetical protein